jgi:hypothetical protein
MPIYSQTLNGPERGGTWSAEFLLDWMFWPTKNLGWFIEPAWSVNPKNGQHSAAVGVGVLTGFPKRASEVHLQQPAAELHALAFPVVLGAVAENEVDPGQREHAGRAHAAEATRWQTLPSKERVSWRNAALAKNRKLL